MDPEFLTAAELEAGNDSETAVAGDSSATLLVRILNAALALVAALEGA